MGIFTKKAKYDIIFQRLVDLINSKKYKMTYSENKTGYNLAVFETKDTKIEVEVFRAGGQAARTPGAWGGFIIEVGPKMCYIEIKVYPKGLFTRLTKSKTWKFKLNSDEYVDDNLKIKDTKILDRILNGYLKDANL